MVNGSCGKILIWTLDDGTLTIRGKGEMEDYTPSNKKAPWYSQRKSIRDVVIENGATSIGGDAFWACCSLTSITIPNSVTSIALGAFCGCTGLKDVYYSGTEEDRGKIEIKEFNFELSNATWHYKGKS